MKSRHHFFSSAWMLIVASCLLAGCSFLPQPKQDPTRYYVLTGPSVAATNQGLVKGTLKIGVRSVSIAPYLDGKAMIVRRGENEIDYCEYARWAEPLATGVSRMLIARLQGSDQVARVVSQPFPFDVPRDVDVAINVLRCEGRVRDDGVTVVDFRCDLEVIRVAGKESVGGEVLLREVFEATGVDWKEGDYAGLARGLSTAVAQLTDAIIAALPAK
ncbi:MAG: PqiC family protein [Verrucomicrobia bacterium]|nr:PqiC family protein [Verrucomicrobiota bacterium]